MTTTNHRAEADRWDDLLHNTTGSRALLAQIRDLLAERLPEPSSIVDPAALASAEVELADACEDLAEVRRERDQARTKIIALTGERDDLRAEAERLRHLLGSHADGHLCTCTMIDPGTPGVEPPEWEQDPWCLPHPDMAVITAEVARLRSLVPGEDEVVVKRADVAVSLVGLHPSGSVYTRLRAALDGAK